MQTSEELLPDVDSFSARKAERLATQGQNITLLSFGKQNITGDDMSRSRSLFVQVALNSAQLTFNVGEYII